MYMDVWRRVSATVTESFEFRFISALSSYFNLRDLKTVQLILLHKTGCAEGQDVPYYIDMNL